MGSHVKQDAREGGREAAKPLTPELSGNAATPPRNSSGNASMAASLLDIRQKVNFLLECVETLATSLSDTQLLTDCKRMRQQGFRRGR